MRLLSLLLLAGCPGPADDVGEDDTSVDSGSPDDTAPPPGCGDGVLDADEACDDGDGNSDTEPDACRTDCLLPACGDGVADAGEACDDGGTWGGDGCDPACATETGTPEVEPNDTWDTATPAGPVAVDAPAEVDGALPADDVDCWSFEVPGCGAVRVRQTAGCGVGLALALHDPSGALLAVGSRGEDGCALLDPEEQPGARWVDGGTWSVCASGVNGAEVRGYALAVETPDPLELSAPAPGGDLDGDGIPDSCDGDVDGDGLDDADDDCPLLSNGPATPEPALSAEGYVRHWLSAGPFTTGVTTGTCRPSADAFVGEDGTVAPAMGDPTAVDGVAWRAALLTGDLFDFLPSYGSVGAPREAYAFTWLHSDTARTLTLAMGADDGMFAWWNGALALDVASCQGVNPDQFRGTVEVVAGWNSLLVKVYDQGGGWGLRARFYDDAGALVTDLVPSLVPEDGWRPDQTDTDGDGVGDVCEPG